MLAGSQFLKSNHLCSFEEPEQSRFCFPGAGIIGVHNNWRFCIVGPPLMIEGIPTFFRRKGCMRWILSYPLVFILCVKVNREHVGDSFFMAVCRRHTACQP